MKSINFNKLAATCLISVLFLIKSSVVLGAPPASTYIAPTDGTNVINAGVNTKTITPVQISGGGKYAMSTYSQFDLAAGDTAIMVLPGSATHYINRIGDMYTNPFNIYGNLESRLGSAAGPIGGNLIFLSKNGIHIGPGATLRTDSLIMATSSSTMMNGHNLNIIPNGTFNSAVLQDFQDSVITYQGLQGARVVNQGILDVNKAVHIVAGAIENTGQISTAGPNKKVVNLVVADNAIYTNNPQTNEKEYILTKENDNPLTGYIDLVHNSSISANEINISSFSRYGSSTLPDVAVNIEGLVNAYGIINDSGKIKLVQQTTDVAKKVRINAALGKGIRATGSDAKIELKTNKLEIAGKTPDIKPLIINSGGEVNIISGNNINVQNAKLLANKSIFINSKEDLVLNASDVNAVKNSYIRVKNLDLNNSQISTTTGPVFLGHNPESTHLINGTLSIDVDNTSKIIAASGNNVISLGNVDNTATYNDIIINGLHYKKQIGILAKDFPAALQGKFIAKGVKFFGPVEFPADTSIIGDNSNTFDQINKTTGDLITPPPPLPLPDEGLDPNHMPEQDPTFAAPPPPDDGTITHFRSDAPVYNENSDSTVISFNEPDKKLPRKRNKVDNKPVKKIKNEKKEKADNTVENPEINSENEKNINFVKEQGIVKIDKKKFKNYHGDVFVNSIAQYSAQENEFNADAKGMEYAAKNGYHPAGIAGFLFSVHDIEKNNKTKTPVNKLFSYRHPETLDRLNKVKDKLPEYQSGEVGRSAFHKMQSYIH